MLYDSVDRPGVEQLVRTFYARLLEDEVVGPIFIRKLGANMRSDKWFEHFNLLDRFWYTMMTGEHGYRGDAFMPHLFLGDLTQKMFDHWLMHFRTTLDEMFVPELADKFYNKAQILSVQFMQRIAENSEEEEW